MYKVGYRRMTVAVPVVAAARDPRQGEVATVKSDDPKVGVTRCTSYHGILLVGNTRVNLKSTRS